MIIKPVFLWTDTLIAVLVIMLVGFAWTIRRNPLLLDNWRKVYQKPKNMIAMLVLGIFVIIGLLDSFHFQLPIESTAGQQYHSQAKSFLDLILSPIDKHQEKTYSAPFALEAYTGELVKTASGIEWYHQPLEYAGTHLSDPQDKYQDIVIRSLRGFALGVSCGGILVILLAWYLVKTHHYSLRELIQGRTKTPWRTCVITFAVVSSLIAICANLYSDYHILGTDKVGNDVFYIALKSIRTGLVIGSLTTLVMLPFAIFLGTAAGYFRGKIDDFIQYLYITLSSIPGVLLIAAAILSLNVFIEKYQDSFTLTIQRSDLRLFMLCVILGVTSWTSLCRLLRGETLKLRTLEYVDAARALGVPHLTIILRHIIPNLMHIILIAIALDFSSLVLAEAVLSYVGVGVDPSTYSWGNMINVARLEMAREPIVWWSLAGAFIMMFILVLSANVFSDAIRDAFDPRVSEE